MKCCSHLIILNKSFKHTAELKSINMKNSEQDLDIDMWSLLNKAYAVKRKIIREISRYNKRWDIKRKAGMIRSKESQKIRILIRQRRELLQLSIKTIKALEELKKLEDRIKSRIKKLKLEIVVIKLFIKKFEGAEHNLPEESAGSLRLSQKLLALKIREVNSYERILDNLERFTKHLNEKTFEHIKNESSIIREQINRIQRESEEYYILFPEVNNRSRLIISLSNLKEINDEHGRIRKIIKYDVITRDKNLISLAKLFFNYKKREPLSLKLLDSLNEKVYKKA